MVYDIQKVERVFAQSHMESANNELKRGVDVVIAKATEVADKIANWDETSQQLSDSTYYTFWRQRRVRAVPFIPDYINAIELYTGDGQALLAPRESLLPDRIADLPVFLMLEKGRPWLCVFRPIMLHDNSNEIFGYVGAKLDFLDALLELNLFTHLDSSSISFTMSESQPVLPEQILNHAHSVELHQGELDQLKRVIYETFAYIVALVVVLLIVLYGMIMVLFARPLVRLNHHIELTKQHVVDKEMSNEALYFSVNEFNNFARSLQEYQLRLNLTQDNLQKLNNELEKRVKIRTAELQAINHELEAFSYSVSHDLRAPLRSIDGFSQLLLEDYSEQLDDQGKGYLHRVRANAQRMAALIDDLLNLARIARVEMKKSLVNLSDIAHRKVMQLNEQYPGNSATTIIGENLYAECDEPLLTVALDNLLGNAWKYSSKTSQPVIEFGCIEENNENVFYVKDNGVGFDMKYVDKVFEVFQRLHGSDYEGTGIGLATVSRILKRHGGRIWVESEPDKGTCFYFTLDAR